MRTIARVHPCAWAAALLLHGIAGTALLHAQRVEGSDRAREVFVVRLDRDGGAGEPAAGQGDPGDPGESIPQPAELEQPAGTVADDPPVPSDGRMAGETASSDPGPAVASVAAENPGDLPPPPPPNGRQDPAGDRTEPATAAPGPAPPPSARPRMTPPSAPQPAPQRTAQPRAASQAAPGGGGPASSAGSGSTGAAGQAMAAGGEPASALPLPENYLGLVRARLQQELRFPMAARERGLSGTAHIRFEIAADGRVGAVTLVRSSGEPSLDREALALPRRVSPLPPPPHGTAQQGGAVLAVPIVFVLR